MSAGNTVSLVTLTKKGKEYLKKNGKLIDHIKKY